MKITGAAFMVLVMQQRAVSLSPSPASVLPFPVATPLRQADAWAVVDARRNVLAWNEAFAQLLGLPHGADRVNMAGLTPPEWRDTEDRALTPVLQGSSPGVEYTLECMLPQGGRLPVTVQATALQAGQDGARMLVRVRPRTNINDVDARVESAARAWKLTAKQSEVLRLVARGLSNKNVADTLGCAESTVELHMTSIFRRSAAKGRTLLLSRLFGLPV